MIPAGYVSILIIGSLSTVYRWRQHRMLPAPFVIAGHRVFTTEQVAEFWRLRQLGEDRWMQTNHGRGRPSIAEIARLALGGV